MFNLFKKRGFKKIEEATKKGFEDVRKDINILNNWVDFFNSEKDLLQKEIKNINENLSSIKEEIEGLKNSFLVIGNKNKVFKTPKQLFKKQTPVEGVQTAVQTAVQTPNFDQFSLTERAIIWVLLNSDMKLSYEDIAAILGKEKTTIRGQINAIKQKSESLIGEIIEKNGKKRVFIPEKIKERLLKKSKVRIKKKKEEN